jgi:formylglycine-generating enzyme required for sulfatase activity
MPTKQKWPSGKVLSYTERKCRIEAARSRGFIDLVRAADFNPAVHFRFFDWRGADLRGLNLRGFDFTGSLLHGARFDDAQIGPGLDANGNSAPAARFDLAELGAILHDDIFDEHEPAPMAPLANLKAAEDWVTYVRSWKPMHKRPTKEQLGPGAIFYDAPFSPQMVVIPAGSFLMGSADDEGQDKVRTGSSESTRANDEGPQHLVTIPRSIAIGRFPVTSEEWNASRMPDTMNFNVMVGSKLDRQPAAMVSWEDAQTYVTWLSQKTGCKYRLLSEAEWEYCCRAGTSSSYAFGNSMAPSRARHSATKLASRLPPHSVGEFPPNAWGLHDMHGLVWEWCQDTYQSSYRSAPGDGTASERSGKKRSRVARGGSWKSTPAELRSASRNNFRPDDIKNDLGFRVARDLRN